ncbi:MAG: heme-binding protein [Pseudomonadota bacterium]
MKHQSHATWTLARTAVIVTFSCAAAHAQVRTEHNMSLELATLLASEAMAVCTAKGYDVSVVVTDRGGATRASLRGDGAGPHTLPSAQQKAFTAVSANATTQSMGERAQSPGGPAYLAHIPGFLLLGGGVPVKLGSEVIGAVGVAGAPRGLQDEQCAMAAIDKVRERLAP